MRRGSSKIERESCEDRRTDVKKIEKKKKNNYNTKWKLNENKNVTDEGNRA